MTSTVLGDGGQNEGRPALSRAVKQSHHHNADYAAPPARTRPVKSIGRYAGRYYCASCGRKKRDCTCSAAD